MTSKEKEVEELAKFIDDYYKNKNIRKSEGDQKGKKDETKKKKRVPDNSKYY